MVLKDPTIHITGEADLSLSRLKYEARKLGKRVAKQEIASFIISHCGNDKSFEQVFFEWVKKQSDIINQKTKKEKSK